MDAQTIEPDLDIGPAVAKLRFFRFAEYVLVFLTIVAVTVFVGLYGLLDETEDTERLYGSSFSQGTLALAMAALSIAIVAGILTYWAAGKLRASVRPLTTDRSNASFRHNACKARGACITPDTVSNETRLETHAARGSSNARARGPQSKAQERPTAGGEARAVDRRGWG